MRRLFMVGSVTTLLVSMVSMPWAAANLNLSKSNINIVVYSTDGMTSTEAAAFVAEMDKVSKVDAITIKQTLQKLLIPTKFKLIRIIPGKPTTVLLLTNAAHEDEAKRIAINDPGMPAEKTPIKSK